MSLEARYLYVLATLLADPVGLTNYVTQLRALRGLATTPDNVARFLAQWAINVVSFRDRDSIMIRFRYDPNPIKPGGWLVPLDPSQPDPIPTPHTVWSCKRPELLISETLALHDRRTEDTNLEVPVPTNTTSGLDNGTHANPGYIGDSPPGHDPNFDSRFKPQGSLFVEIYNPWSAQEPVPGELKDAAGTGISLTRLSTQPDSSGNYNPVWRLVTVDGSQGALDPDDPNVAQQPLIERGVYFVGPTRASVLPPALPPAVNQVVFRPEDTEEARIAPILPGRYAVIGPGESGDSGASVTYLGFIQNKDPSTVDPNNTRRIVLNPSSNPAASGQVAVFNGDINGDGIPDNDLDPTRVTIQPPTAVVINTTTAVGQPQRLSISEPRGGYPPADPNGGQYTTTGYPRAYDIPLDQQLWGVSTMAAAIADNARSDNIKVIHLQRLANPLLPYDPNVGSATYNPYLTIDSMPVDLAAFNGITAANDPQAKTAPAVPPASYLYARQRGQHNSAAGTNNLWRQEPLGLAPTANTALVPANTRNHVMNIALNHSLGFLNDPFGVPGLVAGYPGDPSTPFPWLTWNNRPFVSQLELLLVPPFKSRDLLYYYDLAAGASNPYNNVLQPYPHLLDLFSSGTAGTSTQLHRLLEYVGVASPFVGAETQASPSLAAGSAGHAFHPPFNRISAYREPGRINLNTIYSLDVFYGLMMGFPAMNSPGFWQTFVASRQGNTAPTANVLGCITGSPTEFARPFRSYAGGQLVPLPTLTPNPEINATLLRTDPTSATRPLFQFDATIGGSIGDYNNPDRNPFFRYQGLERLGNLVTTRSNVYAVWITVGYFEVTPASSLPGYAALTPAQRQAIYPDGYTLGRELGVDTGEIERHRAFYIIDRTIPVGFQRGQDLNADKAILVNRFIE